MPKELGHIQKTKDIRIVNVEENKSKTSEYPFICPLS